LENKIRINNIVKSGKYKRMKIITAILTLKNNLL